MIKKGKEILLKTLEKREKSYYAFILTIILFVGLSQQVYAETPKLVSGSVELAKTVTTWLLLIIPVGAGAILGYHALQKTLTDDQAVIAEKNKMMKNTIISAAIGMTASGLITVVLGFYI